MALAAPPLYEAIAVPANSLDPLAKRVPKLVINKKWVEYLGAISDAVDEKPARKGVVNILAHGANISTTPIPLATIGPGVWRVSFIARISRAASTSSSLTVTIAWTRGVAQSFVGAAMIGNTTTTYQQHTIVMRVDSGTPISYSAVYASVGATSMQFELDIVAEELALD